jgi:hypothetical protein
MEYENELSDILWQKLTEEHNGLLETFYGYMPEYIIEDHKNLSQDAGSFKITGGVFIIVDDDLETVAEVKWYLRNNGKISFDFPSKIGSYPIRYFKFLDRYSLKSKLFTTKSRTVSSLLVELGLMKDELVEVKKQVSFDLNKDPKKLSDSDLKEIMLVRTKRDM